MIEPRDRVQAELVFLYGAEAAAEWWPRLAGRLDAFGRRHPHLRSTRPHLDEGDIILITYGDQIRRAGEPPLQTLHHFLATELAGAVSGVHLLPCFPYSSDDGFSVIDYTQIDPALGTWADVGDLARSHRLMFDFVANHISQHSSWFQAYRRGEAPYRDFFIEVDPNTDLSQVVRPRTTPLLTPVETTQGVRHVWTTFSADQMDLNYANPAVLLTMTEVLLHYVAHGASIIRLDAIAYLWKTIGTPCIHLPQTHAVVRLWRAVLDEVAPGVLLITETNVPHAENIAYFGRPLPDGSTDEAQMVYNFSLAPLTLHALRTGNAEKLSAWAATLQTPAPGTAFFNFIASHDGIGIRPAEGILTSTEIAGLVEQTLAHGGRVSYRNRGDGSPQVYELNTTVYDFLNDPARPDPLAVPRFLAAQAILLTLAGVPGIYIHSLFGSRNCHDCFAQTGQPRSLNRRKFTLDELHILLTATDGHAGHVFAGMNALLRERRRHPAFHPAAGQEILDMGRAVFAVRRTAKDASETMVCLVNVSSQARSVSGWAQAGQVWHDRLSGRFYRRDELVLAPYGIAWLTPV
jgi:glycosidase